VDEDGPVVQVAVCGPAECTPEQDAAAWQVGALLAERGVVVLCGAGAGVMAAVARGVRARGGLVVGVHPGVGPDGRPPGLSAVVDTRMGEGRNAVLVASADAVIAVGGSWGTLSEVALAVRRGQVPVVVLDGWRVVDENGVDVPGPVVATTPEQAVELALATP
jgi:uncharacterized protein (TIGR00725 family)